MCLIVCLVIEELGCDNYRGDKTTICHRVCYYYIEGYIFCMHSLENLAYLLPNINQYMLFSYLELMLKDNINRKPAHEQSSSFSIS